MTPRQTALIQTSFAIAAAQGDTLARNFYLWMFKDAPDVRRMFPDNMAAQEEKLMQTLAYIVNGLKFPDALTPNLRELGEGHRELGVEPQHYEGFAKALIEALHETVPEMMDGDTERAWIAGFLMIARIMEPRFGS